MSTQPDSRAADPVFHPVQNDHRGIARVPKAVAMRAYEVYCAIYGEQTAMVVGDCRGGFHVAELVAMLYARSFPRDQWCEREREAYRGMQL